MKTEITNNRVQITLDFNELFTIKQAFEHYEEAEYGNYRYYYNAEQAERAETLHEQLTETLHKFNSINTFSNTSK